MFPYPYQSIYAIRQFLLGALLRLTLELVPVEDRELHTTLLVCYRRATHHACMCDMTTTMIHCNRVTYE